MGGRGEEGRAESGERRASPLPPSVEAVPQSAAQGREGRRTARSKAGPPPSARSHRSSARGTGRAPTGAAQPRPGCPRPAPPRSAPCGAESSGWGRCPAPRRGGLPKGTGSIAPRGRGLRSPPSPPPSSSPPPKWRGGPAPPSFVRSRPRVAGGPSAPRTRLGPNHRPAPHRTLPALRPPPLRLRSTEAASRVPTRTALRPWAITTPPPPSAEPHPAPPPSPGPHPAPGPLPAAVPGAARRWGSRPARSLSMARGGAGGRAVPSCAAPRRPGSPRPAGEESRSSPPRPRACRHRWGGMGWSRDAPPDITAPGTAAGVEADPQPRVRPPPSFLVFSQMPVLTTTLTSPSITWSRSPARMNLKAEPALPAQPPPSGSAAPSPPAQRDADFHPRAPSPPFVGLIPISLPPEAPSTASSCSAPQGDVDAPLHRATLHPTLTPTTGATHGAAAPLGAGRCSDAQFRFLQASPCQRCLFWE